MLPYGSAFPEEVWPAIHAYLQRGGNLLTLGGRPFSQAAYRDCDARNVCAWKLRYPRNAWAKALFINDYTQTPGPKGLSALGNADLPEVTPPSIEWKRAWSPTVRMSAEGLYPRIGTAGTIDMRLDALVWFTDGDNRKLAAPVIEIDHIKNNFVGGRWVMVLADLERPFTPADLGSLAQRALQGAREMVVQPTTALFLPGETPSFEVRVNRFVSKFAAPRPGVDRLRRERLSGNAIVSARHRAVSVYHQHSDSRSFARRPAHRHCKVHGRKHTDCPISHRLLGA